MPNDIGLIWRITVESKSLAKEADALGDRLRATGACVASTQVVPANRATLATPEIIVTIIAIKAAKAVIVAGLHAIERALTDRSQKQKGALRTRIVLLDERTGDADHFPFDANAIGEEAVHRFISDIIKVVEKL